MEQTSNALLVAFNPVIDELVKRIKEEILESTPPKNELRYYTRKEAAALLRMTLPTLHRLTVDGVIECKKLGGRVLYDTAMIDDASSKRQPFKYKRRAKR